MQASNRPNLLTWLKQNGSEVLSQFEGSLNEAIYQEARLLIGGLIAFSLIIVQAFIATGLPDIASYISVIAFAIAIPMLAVFVYRYSILVSSATMVLPPSSLSERTKQESRQSLQQRADPSQQQWGD